MQSAAAEIERLRRTAVEDAQTAALVAWLVDAALTALRAENAALVADNARLMGMLEGEP